MSSPRGNNNNKNNRRRRNRNSSSRSESKSPPKQQIEERTSPRIPHVNDRDRMSPTSKCIREWGFSYYNSQSSGNTSSDDENCSSRSRNSSESSDDGARYAGAKFNSTPPASMLPLPPSHWLEEMYRNTQQVEKQDSLTEMSTHLRQILNVSA